MTQTLTLNSQGELDAYAWPGGYPIIYLDGENSTLCAKCATRDFNDSDVRDEYKPIAAVIYYEGPTIQCDDCGVDIESAYGDPNDDSDEWDADGERVLPEIG